MLIHLDLIFTYWVYVWYLAYMIKLTPYNPKLALIIGIAINILLAILVLVNSGKISSIIPFLVVNTFLKGVPLYTIYNTKITRKDIYAMFGLFLIYMIWLHINNKSIIEIVQKIYESIIHDKNETPAIAIISRIYSHFTTIK